MTLYDAILYPALRLAGVITGAGRGENTEQLTDALRTANRMLDAWNTSGLMIFTRQPNRFTFPGAQPFYTIGPTASAPTGDPDFVMDTRPLRIERANIVLASTPEVRYPLQVLDDKEWSSIRVQSVETSLPSKVYLDGDWPMARLYFWPIPTEANDIELWLWQLFSQFPDTADPANDTDIEISFPPGYVDAIVKSLAHELAQQFNPQLAPSLERTAALARAKVKSVNSRPQKIGTDVPRGQQPYFNYRTGGF